MTGLRRLEIKCNRKIGDAGGSTLRRLEYLSVHKDQLSPDTGDDIAGQWLSCQSILTENKFIVPILSCHEAINPGEKTGRYIHCPPSIPTQNKQQILREELTS
jgi:hypothetical protein